MPRYYDNVALDSFSLYLKSKIAKIRAYFLGLISKSPYFAPVVYREMAKIRISRFGEMRKSAKFPFSEKYIKTTFL